MFLLKKKEEVEVKQAEVAKHCAKLILFTKKCMDPKKLSNDFGLFCYDWVLDCFLHILWTILPYAFRIRLLGLGKWYSFLQLAYANITPAFG